VPHPLDALFNPRTVAIIGASNDPAKRGYRAIRALQRGGYEGRVVPINPREREILGLPCFPSLADVPGEVDAVLVCTPAPTTPGVIEACGRKGVKGAVLLAGGFGEASEEGRRLEEESVAVARRHGVRLVGPNTNGIFGARLGFNALGGYDVPRGHVAIVSNSANVMGSIIDDANFFGHTGFSAALSVGNQADLAFHEYLAYFGEDPDTHAVLSYVEGFKDGPAYMAEARRVSRAKPIVLYAAGRTEAGKRAARSHSGSLAGDYAVGRGVLEQAGVVVVTQSDHLLPVTEALMLFPPMRGRRVAVLSEGGGPITMACEALTERGLELVTLSAQTQAKIHAIVPRSNAIANPVDAGAATEPKAEYYETVSRAILEDPEVDALLIVGFFGGYAKRYGERVAQAENDACRALGRMMTELGKPVMVQSRAALYRTEALDLLRRCGVPFHRHIEVAAQCLASAADWHAARRRLLRNDEVPPHAPEPAAAQLVVSAAAAGRDLLEPEANALLAAYGIATLPHVLLRSAADAEEAVATLGGGPLAVKIVSKDVLHKSDAGGVRLGVSGAAALAEAFEAVAAAVRSHVPAAQIEGVLAVAMAPRGTEVILGVSRDPSYGRVIMFGIGGVFVEVIRDVVFRALPITRDDALEMIDGVHHRAMLDGARGAGPVDRQALCDLLLALSRIAMCHPEIAAIDLNPVIAHGRGFAIADSRVLLDRGAV